MEFWGRFYLFLDKYFLNLYYGLDSKVMLLDKGNK